MAITIVTRTISSEVDQRVQIVEGNIARTIAVGSNWTKLRIGIRLSTTATAADAAPPSFYFGLSAGTPAQPWTIGSYSHFLGISNPASVGWTNSADYISISQTPWDRVQVVGGTATRVSRGIALGSAASVSKAPSRRSAWFMEITKGSPWAIDTRHQDTSDTTDFSLAKFKSVMESATMVIDTVNMRANALDTTQRAPTVDEVTNGYLDTLSFVWLGSTYGFEISDIAWNKIS